MFGEGKLALISFSRSALVDLCEVFIIMMKLKTKLSKMDHGFEETRGDFQNWLVSCVKHVNWLLI